VQRDPEFARTMERVKARQSEDDEEAPREVSASLPGSASREDAPQGAPASSQLPPISVKAPAVASAPSPAGAVPDHAWVKAFDAQGNTLVLRLPGQDALHAITLSRTGAGLDMMLTANRMAMRKLSDSMGELKEKLKARGVDLRSAVVRADDHDESLDAMGDG
jgi:hypothetical protein